MTKLKHILKQRRKLAHNVFSGRDGDTLGERVLSGAIMRGTTEPTAIDRGEWNSLRRARMTSIETSAREMAQDVVDAARQTENKRLVRFYGGESLASAEPHWWTKPLNSRNRSLCLPLDVVCNAASGQQRIDSLRLFRGFLPEQIASGCQYGLELSGNSSYNAWVGADHVERYATLVDRPSLVFIGNRVISGPVKMGVPGMLSWATLATNSVEKALCDMPELEEWAHLQDFMGWLHQIVRVTPEFANIVFIEGGIRHRHQDEHVDLGTANIWQCMQWFDRQHTTESGMSDPLTVPPVRHSKRESQS
ncbi:hypothetical protein [uncultured Tateyamaria sp.]|uniref:hypothetical protein n=1 Tax=uncultured Tateyamaria sp. TaxID=455651 RepID=UPI00262BE2E8|nr:hypothetical protein [uncultured Tateyamaria sp.]